MNIYNMNNSEIELHFRESHILQPKQYNLSDTAKDQPGGHEVAFATPELVTQCIKSVSWTELQQGCIVTSL